MYITINVMISKLSQFVSTSANNNKISQKKFMESYWRIRYCIGFKSAVLDTIEGTVTSLFESFHICFLQAVTNI